jgi:apolipoprotein N-acyltransferase
MPSTKHPLLYSVLSALLFSAAWIFHFAFFAFFAFIPLLMLRSALPQKSALRHFWYVYVAFFLWNLSVTWWVAYASFSGACLAIILNSLLMSFVFAFFTAMRQKIKHVMSVWLLVPIWVAWEYGHSVWDLTWTWLSIGNVFAFHPNWVQWFEYTGTSGGSVWILCTNIFVYQSLCSQAGLKFRSAFPYRLAALFVAPILLSYTIFMLKSRPQNPDVEVVMVQPNVDPYNEKFSLDFRSQFEKMLGLVRGKISPQTDYLVLPETFITENLNEAHLTDAVEIQWFKDSLLHHYPGLKIISGANTYVLFDKNDPAIPATAREDKRGFYFDVYNSAIQIDSTGVQVYHKSKLVPGVERMPFPALMKPLEKFAIDLGGTMGSLGTQAHRTVLWDESHTHAIAPVICYESIFSDYVTEYVRTGADFLFILTNDGWWDNSPGYKQHLNYARLRAIENRRTIARCANTGISCFIDPFGRLSDESSWWTEAVLVKKIEANAELTFFSRHGDLLSYTASLFSLMLLPYWLYLRFSLGKYTRRLRT